ncbi:MAG: cytochrome ubiquinol oxidase subunit I [Desulfovibrio sp.]|jgi:cytochrome d ubiquinol oxidase subunit I|nr:cytochrome ubiquinol oxidase subunit I [Desulfovibrio sp.]
MDVVLLSRLQFAVAVFFHFIFVPLTLGLTVLLAIMETIYVRTGNEQYKRMAKFWGKLFLINFALGIVTGITLEFQFGTNWANYSHGVGDIFGSILAIEATLAFFLESTFVAVWHFGWEKVSKKVHCFAIWAVAFASNLSAVWIIVANGWMQNPVGSTFVNGRALLADFWEVITNPFAWSMYVHTILASWMLAGFFVLGISALHLVKNNETDFFGRSFKLAAGWTLVLSVLLPLQGHTHGVTVAKYQPAKLAAMESHWETKKSAPLYLLVLPDEKNRRNSIEALPIPGFLSFLATGDSSSEVVGLNQIGEKDFAEFAAKTGYKPDRPVVVMADGEKVMRPIKAQDAIPPVMITFLSFRLMIALAILFPLLAILAFAWRDSIAKRPGFARLLALVIPLPYICIMAGWTVAEVGRQPWIVNKLMLTVQGISAVPASSVALSLVAFIVVYGLLGVLDIYLLRKYALKGPDGTAPAVA